MKRKFYLKQVKNNILPLVLLIFSVIYCSDNKLDQDKAVKIYVENIIVEEKYSFNIDSVNFYKGKIYSKYSVSLKDYEDYMYGLKDDPEKWTDFFKKAEDYLTELKKSEAIQ